MWAPCKDEEEPFAGAVGVSSHLAGASSSGGAMAAAATAAVRRALQSATFAAFDCDPGSGGKGSGKKRKMEDSDSDD